jgi:hypothetical protein
MIFLLFKLLVVLIVLIAFLRRPTLVWGIGLLTVTTAVLLDTLLGTFGREEMVARIGFFFYVFSGLLVGGAALWLWGLLRPRVDAATALPDGTAAPTAVTSHRPTTSPIPRAVADNRAVAVDYGMLFQEIKQRFSREDVLDLIFDLDLNENEVMPVNQDMVQLIVNVMDRVEAKGETTALALAVERILTPPPPENLPRLEKITAASPPTILRQYLLTHYDLAQLQQAASTLAVDWENLSGSSKQAKVRELLLFLHRRNRLDELVDWLQQTA